MEHLYEAIFGEAPKSHLDAFSFGVGFAARAVIALAIQRIAEYELHTLFKKGVNIHFMPTNLNLNDLITLVTRKGWKTSEFLYPVFMIVLALLNAVMDQLNALSVDPNITLAGIGAAVIYAVTRFGVKLGASFAIGKALSPDPVNANVTSVTTQPVVQAPQQVASDQYNLPPIPPFAPVTEVVQ